MPTRIIDKRAGSKVLKLEDVVLAPNYRTNFSIADISVLAESIRKVGQLQPVIVNYVGGEYRLVAGQRRYYSIIKAGLDEIKCIVYNNLTPEELSKIQLTENTKKPIGSIGRAESIPRTKEMVEKLEGAKISNNSFASRIHIAPTNVNEAHYYDNLCTDIKRAVEKGIINYAMGIQIGRLEKAKQLPVLNRVLQGDFKNAKELGKYVTGIKKRSEIPETLDLMVQQEDKHAHLREKAKDYADTLKEASSYLQSLFILLEKDKQAKKIIAKARMNQWILGELVDSIYKKIPGFEKNIRKHNAESLEEALQPRKKKHILDIILAERKINHMGETATDLIRYAREAELSIDKIYRDKNQPRKTDTREYRDYVEKLAISIREMGVLTPILVVKRKTSEGDYRIVFGESRWRGSKKAGLKKMPVFIAELDDLSCYIIQLAEDLHRKDSPVERAHAINLLAEDKKKTGTYSKQEFMKDMEAFMGIKPAEVKKYINFLELDQRTKQLVYNKTISFSSALELGKIKDYRQRRELTNIVVAEGLSSTNVKRLISETLQNIRWYSHAQGKEKEFIEECSKASQTAAESEILCRTIKCLAGLESKLRYLPTEERFYKEERLVRSYALLRKALVSYNQIMKM
jgi:ParB family chromosome partitioning protein